MKLPEGKKERVQVLVLFGIGVVFVLFIIVQFGIAPLRAAIAHKQERLTDLEAKLGDAAIYLEQSSRQQKNSNDIIRDLLNLSHHHLLQDEVGNFLLPATAAIQRFGQAVGITNIDVRQVGFVGIPQARETRSQRSFKAYKVHATTFCSYASLVDLVGLINGSSPYISVCGLDIVARPDNPLAHAVSFDVQWPVWVDPTVEQQLLDELQQVNDGGTGAPAPKAREASAADVPSQDAAEPAAGEPAATAPPAVEEEEMAP